MTDTSDKLIAALKSLIVDVESMQERPETFPEQFGPFSDWNSDDERGEIIDWPNLAISVENAKKALAEYEAGHANG